jgi:hypothetical protein
MEARHLRPFSVHNARISAPQLFAVGFEQVSGEVIEDFAIPIGGFDTVSSCRYKVPSHLAIGKVCARLAEDVGGDSDAADVLLAIFSSPFSDEISDFNSSLYFAPRSEVAWHYSHQTDA